MEKRVAVYGFLVVLAVGWNAAFCIAEPRKISEAEKVRWNVARKAVSELSVDL